MPLVRDPASFLNTSRVAPKSRLEDGSRKRFLEEGACVFRRRGTLICRDTRCDGIWDIGYGQGL